MALTINSNLDTLSLSRNLAEMNKTIQARSIKISNGMKVNSAMSDPKISTKSTIDSGISKKKDSMIYNDSTIISNTKDILAVANNSLSGVNDLLNKIGEKIFAVTDPDADKTILSQDISDLAKQVDSTLKNSSYNGTALFSSGAGKGFEVKFGTNGESMNFDFAKSIASSEDGYQSNFSSSLSNLVNISSSSFEVDSEGKSGIKTLSDSLDTLKIAVMESSNKILSNNVTLDGKEATARLLSSTSIINDSKITDVDMASDQMISTKASMLQSVGSAMLAQANMSSQMLVSLFR